MQLDSFWVCQNSDVVTSTGFTGKLVIVNQYVALPRKEYNM